MGDSKTALAWFDEELEGRDFYDYFFRGEDPEDLKGRRLKDLVEKKFDRFLDEHDKGDNRKGLKAVFYNMLEGKTPAKGEAKIRLGDREPHRFDFERIRKAYEENVILTPESLVPERTQRLRKEYLGYSKQIGNIKTAQEYKDSNIIERLRELKLDKNSLLTAEQKNALMEAAYRKRAALGLKPIQQTTYKQDVNLTLDDPNAPRRRFTKEQVEEMKTAVIEKLPWMNAREAEDYARFTLTRTERIKEGGGPKTYSDALINHYQTRNPGRFTTKQEPLDLTDWERLSKADYKGNDALGYTSRLSRTEFKESKEYVEEVKKTLSELFASKVRQARTEPGWSLNPTLAAISRPRTPRGPINENVAEEAED